MMMSKTNNNIAFLFGSGVSIPSKISSTKYITDIIFTGEGIVRGPAENYFFEDSEKFNWDPNQDFIPRIIEFLGLLKRELNEYYDESSQEVNYEDIYYLLDFIRKNVFGAERNPSFKYLVQSFEATIKKTIYSDRSFT